MNKKMKKRMKKRMRKRKRKNVSFQEFHDFIDNYPRELVTDVTAICLPLLKTWNDFTEGDWPHSVIASCQVTENTPFNKRTERNYVENGNSLESGWRIVVFED